MILFQPLEAIKKMVQLHAPRNTKIIKNFLVYVGGALVLRSISLVLAPITLTLLSPADYGLLALVQSFTNIFVIFLGLGLRQVFGLEYFHHSSERRNIIILDIISLYCAFSIPILAILSWHAPVLNSIVFLGNANNTLLYIVLFFSFVYFFAELVYQTLQYQGKATALTALQTIVALVTITCNITALYLGLGIHGMIAGYCIGMLITCCYGIYSYAINHRYAIKMPKPTVQKALYYIPLGLPFIPSVLFGWVLAAGSRWMLARYATLHDVGIYALADTVGALFQMLVLYPMSGSYLPHLFKEFAQNKDALEKVEAWNRKNMWFSMASMLIIITVGYGVGRPLLHYFVPSSYHAALTYVWFILCANIFLMGTYFASALIQFHKRSYLLLATLAIPAALNCLLGFILIPRFCIDGAIAALVTSYLCYFAVTLWFNRHIVRGLSASTKHILYSSKNEVEDLCR